MKYTQKTFTQNGINTFSKALSQQKPVHMDNVITDNLPTDSFSNVGLLTLSSFPNANNYPVNYSNMDDDSLTVDTVISNEGITSTYNVNEIGLTGHVDGDSNETLLAILIADEPFYLPPQSNGDTPIHLIPNITIPLSNSDMQQVSVPVANDVYIAQQDLDKLVRQNGYLKLSDTDSRYVKQSNFNNEVDNAVNNKADKSYVDQNIQQTNNEVDSKANKNDLSKLQDNINGSLQPELDKKATQNDLNTTNINVNNNSNAISNLQNNKADNGDLNGKINQTLNQATTHSDQNLQNANQHSDSNYSDLNDKNNILSNKMEDYQKPNLIDGKKELYDTDKGNKRINVKVQESKDYTFTAEFIVEKASQLNISDTSGSAQWGPYIQPSSTPVSATIHYHANNDGVISIWWGTNDWVHPGYIYAQKPRFVELDHDIPYDIAQSNREKYINNGQLTDDYQAPNLVDDTDDWIEINQNSNNGIGATTNVSSFNAESGKNYCINANYNITGSSGNNLFMIISGAISKTQIVFKNGISSPINVTAQSNGNVNIQMSMYQYDNGSNHYYYNHLTVTQSDSQVPYEVAKRNRLWNQRIVNKTNDLSNTMSQQFSQANAHTDEVANQLNSLDITNQDGKLMHAGKPLLTANAPNAPSLSLSIDSNNGNIQYTITPPSVDGGASITGYTLYYVIEGNSNWQSIPLGNDNLSGEFPATQSQTYEAYVIAHNYAGDSPDSITQSILTASAPTINNLTVTNAYPNGLQYNIDANSNGATITYTIYYKKTSDNNWQSFNSNNNIDSITGINVDINNAYQVQVEAKNIVGTSTQSNITSIRYFNSKTLDYGLYITPGVSDEEFTNAQLFSKNINWDALYPNVKQLRIAASQYQNAPSSDAYSNPSEIINGTGQGKTGNIIIPGIVLNARGFNGAIFYSQDDGATIGGGSNGYNILIVVQGLDSNGNPTGQYSSISVV